ncbi:MAG TPA: hypothetical protein VHM23_11300 [Actinomycetota bacterium]|jgi:hypothetical protein|nr:hypothetical protein [Actinomycetota bacterium]
MPVEARWSKIRDAATWPYRWRRSQVGITRWLIDGGAALFLLDIALFLATAAWARDAGKALEIAIGTVSPFVSPADVVAVPLALLSWLLIPALTGAIIAVVLETKLPTEDQLDKQLDAIREDLTKALGRER